MAEGGAAPAPAVLNPGAYVFRMACNLSLIHIYFFGSVNLSTLDAATGKSSLAQLVLNTPAIYGYGSATDIATLSTDTLVWNGVANAEPGAIATGGAGTGSGILTLNARRIVLGDANGTLQVLSLIHI